VTTGSSSLAPGCPVTAGGYDAVPGPLGPDSLTWRLFGDWRGLLQGPWAGSMQNMHPQLGAAVEQHSIFFKERMPRLLRSLYPIGGVVFDGDRAPQTGAEVRDYHIGIKGVDDQGRRYSALNPDVFYWAHSTFFMGTILTAERFGDGLTEAQKRRLFDEHITWYPLYGMSMRPRSARIDGLHVVAARRAPALPVRQAGEPVLQGAADAAALSPPGPRRLGSCNGAHPG
jgi:uncharacterized protein (DUF2236 family)